MVSASLHFGAEPDSDNLLNRSGRRHPAPSRIAPCKKADGRVAFVAVAVAHAGASDDPVGNQEEPLCYRKNRFGFVLEEKRISRVQERPHENTSRRLDVIG